MTRITFSIYGTHSMFNSPIVSTGKKAVYCLNYTKTLILSLFLYFFTCFVTEDIPSPHGSRQWLECPQYTGTNHMPVYGGINQVYAVTAGATVPAAFAGVLRSDYLFLLQRCNLPSEQSLFPACSLACTIL